jgi:hypothetical protein
LQLLLAHSLAGPWTLSLYLALPPYNECKTSWCNIAMNKKARANAISFILKFTLMNRNCHSHYPWHTLIGRICPHPHSDPLHFILIHRKRSNNVWIQGNNVRYYMVFYVFCHENNIQLKHKLSLMSNSQAILFPIKLNNVMRASHNINCPWEHHTTINWYCWIIHHTVISSIM